MRVYSTDNGWGLFKDESGEGRGQTHRYRRTYTWNSRNQLVSSVDANYSTSYVYGQDGQRSNKYTQGSETLYFNKMWTLHTDNGNSVYGGQYAKNVYLGETRIVTKLARADQKTAHEEMYKQYYYHSDHLGSATMISDWEGKEYQRIEYTPYGETWVEKTNNSGSEFLPYKFTGKEVDQETGLYYYGARYLDPKYSMWISTDPALGEYIPEMGKGNAKDSGSLPGMGGVYNHINFHLYHYAGNNPVRFVDPDGRDIDVSGLCTSDLIRYANAKNELRQTERGRELLSNLESSTNKYKISLNSRSKNNYDPANKTVNWDPDRRLCCTDGKELSPSVLLAHELGHAEQDMISPLPINPTFEEHLRIENENVKNTENPIAATLNSAIRKNYNDVVYASEKNKICGYDLSKIPRGPLTKTQTEMVDKIKFHIAQENMLQDNGVK